VELKASATQKVIEIIKHNILTNPEHFPPWSVILSRREPSRRACPAEPLATNEISHGAILPPDWLRAQRKKSSRPQKMAGRFFAPGSE